MLHQSEKEFGHTGQQRDFPLTSDLKTDKLRHDWKRNSAPVDKKSDEQRMPVYHSQDEFWDNNSKPA